MKVKVPYTWANARTTNFSVDRVRRCGVAFRPKRLSCSLNKRNENGVGEIKEWFKENEISEYKMFGVFVDHPDKVYFDGLMFEFTDEDHVMLFKLRFY